ncbi:MAG TPA: signal peptidase I [Anaerolineae bacterium]
MESVEQSKLSIKPSTGETVEGEVMQPQPFWRSAAEIVVALLLVVFLANILTVSSEQTGSSMAGTLLSGQSVLASRATYMLFAPERGDVVVMRDPLNPDGTLIRRVIGLPGERVELRGRQVLINGQPLNEDYIGSLLTVSDNLTATIQLQLKHSEYYVLGDNRLSINDSRSWGPIQSDDILGRAALVYWPPDSIGAINHQRYPSTIER